MILTPPKNVALLSGSIVKSFAYNTLKDRMPDNLTRVIDSLYRYSLKHGKDHSAIIAKLSELRYELQTNKTLKEYGKDISCISLQKIWNEILAYWRGKGLERWFDVPWLVAECHMYMKLVEIFSPMPNYDWFREQKDMAFDADIEFMKALGRTFLNIINENPSFDNFQKLIYGALWANQSDLSMFSQTSLDYLEHDSKKEYLVHDDTKFLWDYISIPGRIKCVDFVCDNYGAEFFADLCLADYLESHKICSSISFHAKLYPWFVSDVTKLDFDRFLNRLARIKELASLAMRWKSNFDSWKKGASDYEFWMTPLALCEMKEYDNSLCYRNIQHTNLVILKGDLNYRKLVYDAKWPVNMPLATAAGSFSEFSFVAIRTLKSDTIAGISLERQNELDKIDPDWQVNGKFGLIQFHSSFVDKP